MSTSRDSGARSDGPQPSQTGGRHLPFVVADKRVERRKVNGRSDVYRIQCSQARLSKSTSGFEKAAVEWEQPERVEQLSGTLNEYAKRQVGVVRHRPPDRARHLGNYQFA